MTDKLNTTQAVEELTGYYTRQREQAKQYFDEQIEWLKRDLEGTDPHRAIADIEGHLNRLREYSARIDDAQAKIIAIQELGNVVNA